MERLYQLFLNSSGVSIDSRTATQGSLFFALKGESFDGNLFAKSALEGGAAYAIVDNPKVVEDKRYILVEEVVSTLQQLARWHRERLSIEVIAITGSNGKTTTKELISQLLSTKYRVLSTSGNLNNHIGLPLTVLKLTKEEEIAVVEMGASGSGEIELLSSIALPTCGLITNIGKAHLLGFNSLEGVAKAKGELYTFLKRSGGTLFYNEEDPLLSKMVSQLGEVKSHPYSCSDSPIKLYQEEGESPLLTVVDIEGRLYKTNLVGSYNLINIVAALAVGDHFGVEREKGLKAIEEYIPSNFRSQLVRAGEVTLIVDTYNANPTSMAIALDNFSTLKSESKGVILGDMLELGVDSESEHRSILERVEQLNPNYIFLVGKQFRAAAEGYHYFEERAHFFKEADELRGLLSKMEGLKGYFLIKGSRAIKLETILDLFS